MTIIRSGLLGAVLVLLALPAFGQSIQAQNATGSEGGNTTMDIVFNDTGTGDDACIINYQFTMDVSDIINNGGSVNTNSCLNAVPEPHASDGFTDCPATGSTASSINVLVFDIGNSEINAGVGDLIFSGLSEGTYDVAITGVVFTNCNIVGAASTTGIDGTVTISAAEPEYMSSPQNGGLIDFGSVEQGDTGNAILNVSNTGTGTLVISNVVITADAANIFDVDGSDTSFDIASGGASYNVDFTCEPTGATMPGQNQAQVTVSTNDASFPTVDYTLNCIVTEAPDPVSVTLSEPSGDPDCQLGGCNFPDTEVGMSSAAKTYTLSNTGSSSVSGFTIATSNANFSQTNMCGSSLGANTSCTIDAVFNPVDTGPQNATLSVSGGGISPAEASNLTGTGTAAPGDDDDDDDDDDDGGLLVLGNYVSGSYFGGASQDGHGFLIEVLGGSVAKGTDGTFIVYWFAYFDGAQIWLVGATGFSPGATVVEVPMQITSGADFPNDPFDPDAVVREDWGTTTFEFQDDCISGSAGWQAEGDFEKDYGSGELPIVRITQILDCPTVQ